MYYVVHSEVFVSNLLFGTINLFKYRQRVVP